MRAMPEVVPRKLRAKERCLHKPHVVLSEECYLGRRVYVVNVYERCAHACSYCYVEWIHSPASVVAHINAAERLERDLKKLGRKNFVVNLGSATDPYQPAEKELVLTREVLKVLQKHQLATYVCTKSDLILRDLDLLVEHPRCWIGFTITSLDDDFRRIFEPNAPSPKKRISTVQKLVESGLHVVARIDPILPYVNDDYDEVKELVRELASVGVEYVVCGILKLDRSRYVFEGWPSKPAWKRNLKECLEDWSQLKGLELNLVELYELLYYRSGSLLYGYHVPGESYRLRTLSRIKELCDAYGLKFTTCRMGLAIKCSLATWWERGEFRCACYAFPAV